MQSYKKLKVWERSHNLTLSTYMVTLKFPAHELYGLTNQIRRSCVSIPANIAEGSGRGSNADFARFLYIAFGSASELEYYFLLSRDLKYIPGTQYEQLSNDITEIKKMLSSFIKKLKS